LARAAGGRASGERAAEHRAANASDAGRPEAGLDIGWLIELELEEEEPLLVGNHLADALRDMRLLGLQPTLLAPRDAGANGRAA
jgi:hypothetical protein